MMNEHFDYKIHDFRKSFDCIMYIYPLNAYYVIFWYYNHVIALSRLKLILDGRLPLLLVLFSFKEDKNVKL